MCIISRFQSAIAADDVIVAKPLQYCVQAVSTELAPLTLKTLAHQRLRWAQGWFQVRSWMLCAYLVLAVVAVVASTGTAGDRRLAMMHPMASAGVAEVCVEVFDHEQADRPPEVRVHPASMVARVLRLLQLPGAIRSRRWEQSLSVLLNSASFGTYALICPPHPRPPFLPPPTRPPARGEMQKITPTPAECRVRFMPLARIAVTLPADGPTDDLVRPARAYALVGLAIWRRLCGAHLRLVE